MDVARVLGLAKLLIVAAGLVVLWLAETRWPLKLQVGGRGAHAGRNLAVAAVNGLLVAVIFVVGWRWVGRWTEVGRWGLLQWLEWPWWMEAAGAVVLFDSWMYLWHWSNHRLRFLWRFHRMHHSDGWMDTSSALRFHPGEIAISSGLRMAVIPVLGLAFWHLALYEVLLLPVILFHHSNLRVPRPLDDLLKVLIVTPWMHWQHHSQVRAEADSNYSSIFSFWDRLAGTFGRRRELTTLVVGLPGWGQDRWNRLRGMLLTPVLERLSGPPGPTRAGGAS